MVVWFTAPALGEEQLTGTLTVDFSNNTAVYNESYGVKTTTAVTESDCYKCLLRFTLEEGLIFTCEGVKYD